MVKQDKESHYLMIKESIHQEDTIFINIYTPNTGSLKYIKQNLTELEREINRNTIIFRYSNTHSQQWMDHRDRESLNKL